MKSPGTNAQTMLWRESTWPWDQCASARLGYVLWGYGKSSFVDSNFYQDWKSLVKDPMSQDLPPKKRWFHLFRWIIWITISPRFEKRYSTNSSYPNLPIQLELLFFKTHLELHAPNMPPTRSTSMVATNQPRPSIARKSCRWLKSRWPNSSRMRWCLWCHLSSNKPKHG